HAGVETRTVVTVVSTHTTIIFEHVFYYRRGGWRLQGFGLVRLIFPGSGEDRGGSGLGAVGGDGSGTVGNGRGWAKGGRTRSDPAGRWRGVGARPGVGGAVEGGIAWVRQSHFVATLNSPTWPTWRYSAV